MLSRKTPDYFSDKVALVTGGSTGLGFILADKLLGRNCKVIICARDQYDLKSAKSSLTKEGVSPDIYVCDVGQKDQVDNMIRDIISKHNKLDFIFNNAGIITVGPMENFSHDHYRECMDIMYWGTVNTTLSALPHMKERQSGHIVNITSVGGKISVPHLLAYSSAKFAAVGFSEGCAAELGKDNIHVTTIIPGLMRTGSYVNALFPKGMKKEFKLFSFMSSMPGITLNAEKAARRILKAVEKQRSQKVLGLQTKAAIEFHHFFPNTTVRLFSLVTKMLPFDVKEKFEPGLHITERDNDAEVPVIRNFGERAQENFQ